MKNTQNIIEEIQNLKGKYCVSAYLEIRKVMEKNGISKEFIVQKIEFKSKQQEIKIKLDEINISYWNRPFCKLLRDESKIT